MTDVNANTFLGPNQGNTEGYIPQTTIESSKIDADLLQIKNDSDYHLSQLQQIYAKLDQINLEELGAITADQIVPIINASALKIDADNLADSVVVDSELTSAIGTHRTTTTQADMHPESSIKSTELTYSNTPVTLITNCVNILDELKNIRYQINRLNGKTSWTDTPDSSLASLYSSLNSTISTLTSHVNNAVLHLNATQYAALCGANNPSASNPFATVNDVDGLGSGDMTKAMYDPNRDGIIDKSVALVNGSGTITYDGIVSKIASDIATHRAIANAHGNPYTDAQAIGAINNDTDHSSTARHYYGDLLNKPAATSFTTTEVNNLRASKLANGTIPWDDLAKLGGNGLLVPTISCNSNALPSVWNESMFTRTNSFMSSSSPGGVQTTFGGPVIITGGYGYKSSDYGYLQVSVNGGGTWTDVTTTPDAAFRGPNSNGDNMKLWSCPSFYIPSGKSLIIRAGSIFGPGTSENVYGGGYIINIRSL